MPTDMTTFTEESAQAVRGYLSNIETSLRNMIPELPNRFAGQKKNVGEINTNIMLAVRHIEDARMRIGKALQHMSDGVSIYDEIKTTMSTEPKT